MASATVPKTYDCAVCKAELRSQRDLDNHMCLAHDQCGEARLGTPITFRCAACGEAFERRGDLYEHQVQCGHGHPHEFGKARPPAGQRGRGRPRGRTS
jgi:uncharacterized C2H2 Zn-finger protein